MLKIMLFIGLSLPGVTLAAEINLSSGESVRFTPLEGDVTVTCQGDKVEPVEDVLCEIKKSGSIYFLIVDGVYHSQDYSGDYLRDGDAKARRSIMAECQEMVMNGLCNRCVLIK